MKLSIYQVRIGQDTLNLAFRDLATVLKNSDNGRFPSEYYDRVYTGEVEAETLEDVFAIFNLDHPLGYRGRSLSQSDVVEVYRKDVSEFYFCDTCAFVPIEFDKDNWMEGDGR